jgi:hypothetical protein
MHFAIPETREQFLEPETRKGPYVVGDLFAHFALRSCAVTAPPRSTRVLTWIVI